MRSSYLSYIRYCIFVLALWASFAKHTMAQHNRYLDSKKSDPKKDKTSSKKMEMISKKNMDMSSKKKPTQPPATKKPKTFPPSHVPTESPSENTRRPSSQPTNAPSMRPTNGPTPFPTALPTISPTEAPTISPSDSPSISPSEVPSKSPSQPPSISPTSSPSFGPSMFPSRTPSSHPSVEPTLSLHPSFEPSHAPSMFPSVPPTITPTRSPSNSPSGSAPPSLMPSASPTDSPAPSLSPTEMIEPFCELLTGTLGGSGNTMLGRIRRNQEMSTCENMKPFPGEFGNVERFWEPIGPFRNTDPGDICMTMEWDFGTCFDSGDVLVHPTAYLSFNPQNISQGYLGDNGLSGDRFFSFIVPGNTDFFFIGQQVFPGTLGLGCTFAVLVDPGNCTLDDAVANIEPTVDFTNGHNSDENLHEVASYDRARGPDNSLKVPQSSIDDRGSEMYYLPQESETRPHDLKRDP